MATERVICVYYLEKKSLTILKNETFKEIGEKFILKATNGIKFKLECSTNDRDWTVVDEDVLLLPAIGVIDAFSYKYIRITVVDTPNSITENQETITQLCYFI